MKFLNIIMCGLALSIISLNAMGKKEKKDSLANTLSKYATRKYESMRSYLGIPCVMNDQEKDQDKTVTQHDMNMKAALESKKTTHISVAQPNYFKPIAWGIGGVLSAAGAGYFINKQKENANTLMSGGQVACTLAAFGCFYLACHSYSIKNNKKK